MNRSARRALKRDAPAMAERLANCCLDFEGCALVKVADLRAIVAFCRAFSRMIKIGARVVRHARTITFQLAEVADTGSMVRANLAAIHRLRAPPLSA